MSKYYKIPYELLTNLFRKLLYKNYLFNKKNIVTEKISKDEYFIKYQPICNIHGDFIGVEALIRWIQKKGDPSSPSELIEQAIKYKQIVPLTHHISSLIYNDFTGFVSNKYFSIALNVELDHINDENFVSDMIFFNNQLPDQYTLVIELSERSLIRNTESIIYKLQELRKKGVKIALDDFGSGFSSLTILDYIPLDIVKLDSAFIDKPIENIRTSILIKSIKDMCTSLGIDVIAEGVSSEEQFKYLARLGIEKIQGYSYSKPLKFNELKEFIESR